MGLKTRTYGGGTKGSPKTCNPRKGTETFIPALVADCQRKSEDL